MSPAIGFINGIVGAGVGSISVARGGGGAAAPSDPPGAPLLWWKADGTLYSDAGSTPAGDGDSVQQWVSQGSNALVASNASANDKPVLRTSYASSGYPALEFHEADGNDFLTASGEPDLTGAVTILAAIYLDASGGGEILNVFQTNVATENAIRFAVQAADDYLVFGRPYSTDATGSAAVAREGWVVVAAVAADAPGGVDLYHDGETAEAEALNDDGVHNDGDLWIGRFDSQFFDDNMDGGIGEIIVYDSALGAEDLTTAVAYLKSRFGVA